MCSALVELRMTKVSWYKKAVFWICGIDHRVVNDQKLTDRDEITERDHKSLAEDLTQATIINGLAIIMFSLAVFIMVFYA